MTLYVQIAILLEPIKEEWKKMAVLRQNNWLGQQRIDIPQLRITESSICADFDVLAGRIIAGMTPMVIQGFDTITVGMTGQPASTLQINVANSLVMHPTATESGTIFWVPANRAVEVLGASNTRVKGGFTANAVNYVGIDLNRSADATTADLVQFLNPQTNLETPKSVPLGRTLDYTFFISTQDFSATPGLCPICIITTDSSNNIVSNGIVDARELFYRLGSGGSVPNTAFKYSWPGGRTETGNNTDFGVGDKAIGSMKDWADAIMTRLWELGGGSYWYSPTNSINIEMIRTGSPFVSNGQYFEWDGTNLHWKGLVFLFDNTVGWNNVVNDQTSDSSGLTNLADGDCLYVDIIRTSNATISAVKGTLATLGSSATPGNRMIIAWRKGTQVFTRNSDFAIGTAFAVATTSAVGVVKLAQIPGAPGAPVVFNPISTGKLIVNAISGNDDGIDSTGNGTGVGIWGIGGANGTGVLASGNGTGHGVSAQALGSGSAFLARANNGNETAIIRNMNANNKGRFVIDHMGYPAGARVSLREYWQTPINLSATQSPITLNPMWKATVTGTAAITVVPANNNTGVIYNTNACSVGTNTASGANGTMGMTLHQLGFDDNSDLVFETEVYYTQVPLANQNIFVGINDTGVALDLQSNCIRFKILGTGTWVAEVKALGLSATTSSVVSPTGTPQRLRIEVYGINSIYGKATARFFIDTVLVATIDSTSGALAGNFPTDSSGGNHARYGLAFGVFNTAVTASGPGWVFGAMRADWNLISDLT